MAEGLSPEHLEQVRRSLAMSPSRMSSELLTEVQRLRRQFAAIADDLEAAGRAITEARRRLPPDP